MAKKSVEEELAELEDELEEKPKGKKKAKDDDEPAPKKKATKKEEPEEEEEDEGPDFDDMDEKALLKFIKKNDLEVEDADDLPEKKLRRLTKEAYEEAQAEAKKPKKKVVKKSDDDDDDEKPAKKKGKAKKHTAWDPDEPKPKEVKVLIRELNEEEDPGEKKKIRAKLRAKGYFISANK